MAIRLQAGVPSRHRFRDEGSVLKAQSPRIDLLGDQNSLGAGCPPLLPAHRQKLSPKHRRETETAGNVGGRRVSSSLGSTLAHTDVGPGPGCSRDLRYQGSLSRDITPASKWMTRV